MGATTHTAVAVSEGTIRTVVLDHVLDANALNQHQDQLLHRPDTEDVDSIFEHLGEVISHVHSLVLLCNLLRDSNSVEGEIERTVAGWADRVSSELRMLELNGGGGAPSGRRLAEVLRSALEDMDAATGDIPRAVAAARIVTVFERVPSTELFRPTTIRHLRKRNSERIAVMHAEWLRQCQERAAC